MNNKNVPINNLQKTAYIEIDDSHPYRAEQVKISPQKWFLSKIIGQFLVGGWIPFS